MPEIRIEECENCGKEAVLIGLKRVATTAWFCRACLEAALALFARR
jgi:ribosomal protein L37AE/L43A